MSVNMRYWVGLSSHLPNLRSSESTTNTYMPTFWVSTNSARSKLKVVGLLFGTATAKSCSATKSAASSRLLMSYLLSSRSPFKPWCILICDSDKRKTLRENSPVLVNIMGTLGPPMVGRIRLLFWNSMVVWRFGTSKLVRSFCLNVSSLASGNPSLKVTW